MIHNHTGDSNAQAKVFEDVDMHREFDLTDIMKYQLVNEVKIYENNLELCAKIRYRDYWIKHHYSDEQTLLEI